MSQENKSKKTIYERSIPYVVTVMLGLTGFLAQQTYSQLSAKPTVDQVEIMINHRVAPLQECVVKNTTAVSILNVNLKVISTMNKTIQRIDERTRTQGEDIALIKGKLNIDN